MKNARNWKTFNSVTPGIEEIGGRNLLAARSMCKLWLPEGKSEGPPQWRMDCLDGQNPEDDDPRAPRPDKSVWRSRRDTTTPSFRMQNIHEDANDTLSDGCKTSMRRLLIHQRTSHSLIHNRFLPRNWQPGVTQLAGLTRWAQGVMWTATTAFIPGIGVVTSYGQVKSRPSSHQLCPVTQLE
jgi:hypothetical protein